MGVVLRWHIEVGLAAPHGFGEGDPYCVHLGRLGGDAPVTAEGGGGAVCPHVLDRRGGDSWRLGEGPRFQLARPFSGPGAGGPRQDPGGDGRPPRRPLPARPSPECRRQA